MLRVVTGNSPTNQLVATHVTDWSTCGLNNLHARQSVN